MRLAHRLAEDLCCANMIRFWARVYQGFYEPAAEVISRYVSMASMPLSGTSQLRSSYMAMQTALEMKQADHVSIDGLVADSYEFTFDRWACRSARDRKVKLCTICLGFHLRPLAAISASLPPEDIRMETITLY